MLPAVGMLDQTNEGMLIAGGCQLVAHPQPDMLRFAGATVRKESACLDILRGAARLPRKWILAKWTHSRFHEAVDGGLVNGLGNGELRKAMGQKALGSSSV